jgi:hypothetical protein
VPAGQRRVSVRARVDFASIYAASVVIGGYGSAGAVVRIEADSENFQRTYCSDEWQWGVYVPVAGDAHQNSGAVSADVECTFVRESVNPERIYVTASVQQWTTIGSAFGIDASVMASGAFKEIRYATAAQ